MSDFVEFCLFPSLSIELGAVGGKVRKFKRRDLFVVKSVTSGGILLRDLEQFILT